MSLKTLGRMSQGMSLELGCQSVVILTGAADPDAVIEFAYSIGAITDTASAPDAPPTLVVDFRYVSAKHSASDGAALYSEEDLRTLLDSDLNAAAS